MEDRLAPATVNWIAITSGLWNVAANWRDSTTGQNRVPTAADDVTINQAGATVTMNDTESVNSVATASGTTLALTAGSNNESRPH